MLKKSLSLTIVVLLFMVSTASGEKISFKGRVIDNDGKPVKEAMVKLITARISQTTDSEGKFSFNVTSANTPQPMPLSDMILFRNGFLSFNVPQNQREVHVEVFDNKGQRIKKTVHDGLAEGIYTISVLSADLPFAMYVVKMQLGKKSRVFNVLNLKNQMCLVTGNGARPENEPLRRSASSSKAVDTLETGKDGYITVKTAINSYVADVADIVLKSNVSQEGLPPVVNGKRAKTTRYWDCCKPHCGWRTNMRMCDIDGKDISDQNAKSGCDGGPAFQCMDYAPVEVNSKVSYGWVAFNNSGTQCGDCFQLDFQGALSGKQMVVQVINIGNGGTDAFDILIPGGGVGALNGCSRQWNNAPLGTQYGGFHSTCGDNAGCIRGMCEKAFGNRADLMRGCEWYLDWFKMTSNPEVLYMKVSCPQGIKDISKIGN